MYLLKRLVIKPRRWQTTLIAKHIVLKAQYQDFPVTRRQFPVMPLLPLDFLNDLRQRPYFLTQVFDVATYIIQPLTHILDVEFMLVYFAGKAKILLAEVDKLFPHRLKFHPHASQHGASLIFQPARFFRQHFFFGL